MERLDWDGMHFLMKMHLHKKREKREVKESIQNWNFKIIYDAIKNLCKMGMLIYYVKRF